MPGAASLRAAEYYAHPRNAFWKIAESLWRVDQHAAYDERVRALQAAGVAVWDVLRTCRRSGSLDSGIERESAVANDFREFLQHHPGITRVYFNGNTARDLYDRHVLATLPENLQLIARYTLPSTSPANARLSLLEKTRAWHAITQPDD